MNPLRSWKTIVLACILCAPGVIAAPAQTLPLTTVVNFNGANGQYPNGYLIQGADGNFYGTTVQGGSVTSCNGVTAGCPCAPYGCGTIFKLTPAGALTTLYNFCSQPGCADGYQPAGNLVQGSDGNFYGVTRGGGIFETFPNPLAVGGTVFQMTPAGAVTTIYNFCSESPGACFDGQQPYGGLIQATDGNFYGTTLDGGTNGMGTVFRVSTTGTEDTLYSFCSQPNCADGASPAARLLQASDGNFYGTTNLNGANGVGTIFQITPQGVLTTVHTFTWATEGGYSSGELVQAKSGNFYGTTWSGGAHGYGTVFEMNPGGAGAFLFSTIYNFCSQSNCADGTNPPAGLIQAIDGNFYSVTFGGGANGGRGTVFRITSRGALTTLHSFDFTDGSQPDGTLLEASNGLLYGATAIGGGGGCASEPICGTIFSLAGPVPAVVIGVNPTRVSLGGTISVTAQLVSCCTPQSVVVRFTLNGPLQPNSCSSAETGMFTTPPLPLPAKFSETLSFPFRIPSSGVCPGTYSINATTLVNGATMDSSTATLTITP
jgi:uncharacterized repeat protein (TIGR03803 family)